MPRTQGAFKQPCFPSVYFLFLLPSAPFLFLVVFCEKFLFWLKGYVNDNGKYTHFQSKTTLKFSVLSGLTIVISWTKSYKICVRYRDQAAIQVSAIQTNPTTNSHFYCCWSKLNRPNCHDELTKYRARHIQAANTNQAFCYAVAPTTRRSNSHEVKAKRNVLALLVLIASGS